MIVRYFTDPQSGELLVDRRRVPEAPTSNERSQWFIVLYEWQGCQQMTTDAAWWPSAEIMGAEVGALATVERLHRGEQPRRGQLTYRNIRGPFPWTEQPASAPETKSPQGWMCACGTFNYAACCQECNTLRSETPAEHRECRFDEHAGTCTWIGCPNNSPGSPTHCPLPWPRASEKTNCVDGREGHKAEQVSALRESGLPASQREPPHCSTCSCGMDKP